MLGPQPLTGPAHSLLQTSNDELACTTSPSKYPIVATAKMLSSELPEREQVPTASKLPHAPLAGLHTQDVALGGDLVDNWREYCDKQRETFDAERKLWAVERNLLGAQISQLQNELMVVNSKLKQLELSNDTKGTDIGDRLKSNITTNFAEAKDMSTKDVFAEQSNMSKVHFASESSGHLHDIIESNSLPNVLRVENGANMANTDNPDILVSENNMESDSPSEAALRSLHDQERPLSPPVTASILSPPPENYRRFAGHTPGGSMNGQLFSNPETDKAQHPILLDKTNTTDTQEDVPLKGPLGLGASPESTLDILHTLDEKLQDVKDNPEQLTPSVLVGEKVVTNNKLSDKLRDHSISSTLQPPMEMSASTSDAPQSKVFEQVVDGPKLRVKRSMNFGAPLGTLNAPFT